LQEGKQKTTAGGIIETSRKIKAGEELTLDYEKEP
jgi:SET domain-containing protein